MEPFAGLEVNVSRRVLRDSVYDALLDMLLDGRAPAGRPLSIEGLARGLGVSPTPVREALAELEHTGLVTRSALRGYRVAEQLDAQQMSELLAARRVIEVASVRSAVPLPASGLAELTDVHEQHAAAADRLLSTDRSDAPAQLAAVRAYTDIDWQFHLVLLRHSGNRYLSNFAMSLTPHMHRLRQMASNGRQDVMEARHEHGIILEAVAAGDPEAAARAMSDHLEAVTSRALEDITAMPDGDVTFPA